MPLIAIDPLMILNKEFDFDPTLSADDVLLLNIQNENINNSNFQCICIFKKENNFYLQTKQLGEGRTWNPWIIPKEEAINLVNQDLFYPLDKQECLDIIENNS